MGHIYIHIYICVYIYMYPFAQVLKLLVSHSQNVSSSPVPNFAC